MISLKLVGGSLCDDLLSLTLVETDWNDNWLKGLRPNKGLVIIDSLRGHCYVSALC